MAEEPFLPLKVPREKVPLTTSFRSTWLRSSMRSIEQRQLRTAYLRQLPARYHDTVTQTVAGDWLPIEVAEAHYRALDRLELPEQDQLAIGSEAQQHFNHVLIQVTLRAARAVGVTPWAALRLANRSWESTWVGGAVAVYKLGPREARFEMIGWTCASIRYCRVASRGMLDGSIRHFCKRASIQELPRGCSATELTYILSWS